jgi:RNA polymerase sigma-70 factor (ECF subfamily)
VSAADDSGVNPPSAEVTARLVAGHRQFLSFLQARLPSRAIAEDILQAAFVRAMEKGGGIQDSESAVAWFYRLLRNSLVDYYRHKAIEERAVDQQAKEAQIPSTEELRGIVCACMNTLLPNLKAEYAQVLRRVDIENSSLAEVAAELDITANNATVRLHRARQALKRELERSCGTCATHGCLNCTCGASAC